MLQLISGTAFGVSVCKGSDNVTPTIRVLHINESLIDALGMRVASPESLAISSRVLRLFNEPFTAGYFIYCRNGKWLRKINSKCYGRKRFHDAIPGPPIMN